MDGEVFPLVPTLCFLYGRCVSGTEEVGTCSSLPGNAVKVLSEVGVKMSRTGTSSRHSWNTLTMPPLPPQTHHLGVTRFQDWSSTCDLGCSGAVCIYAHAYVWTWFLTEHHLGSDKAGHSSQSRPSRSCCHWLREHWGLPVGVARWSTRKQPIQWLNNSGYSEMSFGT